MDYKEKLEEAKRLYETANADQKYLLESLFPELKSKADERIRKDIISFLRSKNGYMNPNEDWDFHNRWLPWLEKQGKQKPDWSEEDVAMLDSAIAFVSHSPFTVIGKGKSNVIAWLKSLKDRYTWKPSDEIMKGLNEIINKLAISPVIHEHGYLYDLMVNLRKKLKG